MARITVTLKPVEKEALRNLAERERRDPCDQAALIICRELVRQGLLVEANRTLRLGFEWLVRLVLGAIQLVLQFGPILIAFHTTTR